MTRQRSRLLRMMLTMLLTAAVLVVLTASCLLLLRSRTMHAQEDGRAQMERVLASQHDALLDMAREEDYEQLMALFAAEGMMLTCVPDKGGVVAFECWPYTGFYYSSDDQPERIPGIEPPWIRYFQAEGSALLAHLRPEKQGYAWHEAWVGSGDNSYYTQRLSKHFWYYAVLY